MRTKEELNRLLLDKVQKGTALEVELLIQAGADIGGWGGPFPLTSALDIMLMARPGFAESDKDDMDICKICKLLIDAGSNLDNALSALTTSSRVPSKLVQMLIDAGADPTAQLTFKDSVGTILDEVVYNLTDSDFENIEFAKILMKSGAQLNTEVAIGTMEKLISKLTEIK